ncbi:ionotropic receptor 93a-like [Portunus trituberculatus]|uniref:ionotropic receptor 93a-like n=1 Tax=Portunus trituberculatus TaxID=210409 RepID=UPI001E1CD711|nr:ionotropic receptor 93a-like [Portunus trituberculatus]
MRALVTLQFLLHVAHPLVVTSDPQAEVSKEAVRAVLGPTEEVQCTLLLLAHKPISQTIYEIFLQFGIPVGIFEVRAAGKEGGGAWLTPVSDVVVRARHIRRSSWCVTVVVMSDDPDFLAAFAESTLKHRLLGWATRLLVLARLPLHQVHSLLSSHWTFSMMNAMVLNQQRDSSGHRYLIEYFFFLLKHQNKPVLLENSVCIPTCHTVPREAMWCRRLRGDSLHVAPYTFHLPHSSQRNFRIRVLSRVFYDLSFYGATVNVSVLPYAPYWEETVSEAEDGTLVKTYSGTDYELLYTMSTTLNFTIHVLPSSTWEEVSCTTPIHVGQLVADRVSFMSPMHHVPVAQRLKIYDFSYGYEYGSFAFSAATPSLRPRWQSLYYPLSDFVWLAVLAVVCFVPLSFYAIRKKKLFMFSYIHRTSLFLLKVNLLASRLVFENKISFSVAIEMVIATLLSQNLSMQLPKSHANRGLLIAWLLFAFIVGTVYRSNLTAALTLPKYPPRPETVEDMVEAFDRISMPSYGGVFIENFKKSSYSVFREMGEKMFIIKSALEAMQRSRDLRESHVGWESYMATIIARHFIMADGSAQIYLGRESVSRTLTAWPLPHDAPFKRQVDVIMVKVLEAGLYEKWRSDFLEAVKKETRKKQKTLEEEAEGSPDDTGGFVNALNLVHMQGPLLLLLLGLTGAGFVFTVELPCKS